MGNDHLAWWPDSAETAVVVLREALADGHDFTGAPYFAADLPSRQQNLAAALALRGRLREAMEVDRLLLEDLSPPRSPAINDIDPFLDLALLSAIPDSMAARAFAQSLDGERDWADRPLAPLPRYLRGLPWWLARGDIAAIARFGRRAEEIVRRPASHRAALRARYFARAAPAYLALARGDSARAVTLFQAIPDTLCIPGRCVAEKLTLARLLSARGDDRGAAALIDRWSRAEGIGPLAVLAELERGRVAERLGDRARALATYRFVVEVWRGADPELRPYVEEARQGLRRLSAVE